MAATKKWKDLDPNSRREFLSSKHRWILNAGIPNFSGIDWEASSPFGSVGSAIVFDSEGKPLFDRPYYAEAPNVNCVVWGKDKNGVAKFAVISQPRPHADDPEKPGDNHKPVVFGQIVMGFLEKLVGQDLLEKYENTHDGAIRETAEESGAQVILDIEHPAYPWHNPNPTFVKTWSDLLFIEADLKQIAELKKDRNEPIFKAEYITAEELRQRIADGKDEDGAVYRDCTSLSTWFIFFCCHPELFI